MQVSLERSGENIRELLAFLDKSGSDNEAIDVLKVGNLLQGVVFSIVLEQFVEGIAYQKRVFEFRQLPQLIELIPTPYPVV